MPGANTESTANSTWGGRFSGAMTEAVAAYNASYEYDRTLWRFDIEGSLAHARMLAAQGIISQEDEEKIRSGLGKITDEIESGVFDWKQSLEDVHMNIESRLIELIGDAGKKLHTGRSRNDQVALAFRLYVSDACSQWAYLCETLCAVLCDIAANHTSDILPGCTHFQPAQPVSLAQHMLAYAFMFKRDIERIEDSLRRIRISPLGAAALAGSTYSLDPGLSAQYAGFIKPFDNSMDAVSDRDFVLEALFIGACISMHLSRICEELIIWANPAFGFISLPDEFSTGSSIMPQKKNPDVAELMRGKTGRVYGNLFAMLTVLKSLPLAYNKDLQEDKEGFFDTDKTLKDSLSLISPMLQSIRFNACRMRDACRRGYINATELADYLAVKGVPFREAHHITGRAVALAEKQDLALEQLPLEQLQQLSPLIAEDIHEYLDYEACVKRRESPGGTGPKSVETQISVLRSWLQERSRTNDKR